MIVNASAASPEAVCTSNSRPDFEPFEESLGTIHGFVDGDDLVTLSADHRLVDGEMGAPFLNALRRRLQDVDAIRAGLLNA